VSLARVRSFIDALSLRTSSAPWFVYPCYDDDLRFNAQNADKGVRYTFARLPDRVPDDVILVPRAVRRT
jgi:hypothetical protein